LSEDELTLFRSIIGQAHKDVVQLLEAKQVREILPIEKWLESEYYIGRDGQKIYDFWKEVIIDIFKDGQKYNEIIFEASLGTGKSTIGLYILIRKLYEMSCFENIPALYGLMSTASTFFMYLAPTLTTAESTGYGQLRNTLDTIPYFCENFQRNPNKSSTLEFPEHIVFAAGSTLGHIVGSNLIASILDEGNFFSHGKANSPDVHASVAHIHNSIVTRGQSRFLRNCVNNSLSILISSPTYRSSYTQSRIQQAENNPRTKVITGSLWSIKGRHLYSPKSFYVFKGTDKLDPLLINSVADINSILSSSYYSPIESTHDIVEAYNILEPTARAMFDEVPDDFRSQYENALVQALQDISGISVNAQGRFFTSRVVLGQAVDKDLPEWFTKTEFPITTGDDNPINRVDYFLKDHRVYHRETLNIHFDYSLSSDCTGIAGAHRSGSVFKDGQELPVVTVDFALKILPPPPPQQISISRVRQFVFTLRNLGYNIGAVTMDSFQSSESIQILQENNFHAYMYSVNRTDEEYLAFINMLYENRIKFNQQVHDEIAKEIFYLIHYRDKRKVDHPPKQGPNSPGNDIMDAVVGAVWSCISDETIIKQKKAEQDSLILASVNRELYKSQSSDVISLNSLLSDYLKPSS